MSCLAAANQRLDCRGDERQHDFLDLSALEIVFFDCFLA